MNVTVQNQKGFSLVELMVVVAIIGILAAIAIPNFQRFSSKSKQSEAKSNLSAIYAAERGTQAEWNTFSTSWNVVGYRPTGWLRYQHGFNNNFPAAMPPGYAGPPQDAISNSSVYCGNGVMNANNCGVINTPIAPIGVAGAAMTSSTFLAIASANITGTPGLNDTWIINHQKVVANTANGLP